MSRFSCISFLTLAVLAATVSSAIAQAPSTPPVAPEIEAGVQKLREGKVDDAIKLFEEARLKHPEIPPAWILMYRIFAEQNDPNKARQSLEQAVLSSPTDPEAYVILGTLAMQEHRLAEAELLYMKSQSLLSTFAGSPQRKKILDAQTISGLAQVDELRTKWDLAEKQLTTLLEMEPNNAQAMQRMARALFFEKKTRESLAMLRKAKAADAANVLTPEAILAGFYEQYGDHADAVTWFDKALVAAPNDLATHRIVANWAINTGDIKKAKEQAEACLKINANSLDNMILRGVIALFEEDFAKAEEYFQLAQLQSPGNLVASNNLALALCEQVDPTTGKPNAAKLQRAYEYAKQNYDANQRNPDACSTLGWVLFKKKEYDQAALALQASMQASGNNINSDTAYYLAMVDDVRNNKARAKSLLEAVLKTDRPFSKRKAARELLARLEKEVPATPAATGTGTGALKAP